MRPPVSTAAPIEIQSHVVLSALPATAYRVKPTPAAASIMPSIAMLTTPDRSAHRPAIAPSAIGVPRRSDSTISWMTFVSFASDNASERMTISGARRIVETSNAPRVHRS